MTKVWKLTHLGSTDKLVLLALADNANDNGVCWPSVPRIADKASLSDRAVRNSIARLQSDGQIQIEERYGRSNVFTITPVPRAGVHDVQGCTPFTPNPCTSFTPASGAPLHDVPQPLHHVQDTPARGAPTPARGAPITIKESSGNHQEPSLEGREKISPPVPATTIHPTESEISRFVMTIKSIYPPPNGRVDWISGEKAARQAVLNDGATWPELIEGTRRMAEYVKATRSFVLAPKRFFGEVDRPWSQAWSIPDNKPQRKSKFELATEGLSDE